jgi:ubiquinone/menaquinone biosynthesis C-methylase UbiE
VFDQRVIEPELLDHLPAEEARPNLADLVRINRSFGGHSVLRDILARVVTPGEVFTLLDVGAASGDSAGVIKKQYASAQVVNLDYNATNLEKAPFPKVIADAFELPFGSDSFDFVLCSLFLHHFENEQVIQLLRVFHRISRRALLVCDLDRHILPYVFLSATKPLYKWNSITVHDGLRSVRASFRRRELEELAVAAGIRNPEVRRHRPAFRLSLIGRK